MLAEELHTEAIRVQGIHKLAQVILSFVDQIVVSSQIFSKKRKETIGWTAVNAELGVSMGDFRCIVAVTFEFKSFRIAITLTGLAFNHSR